MVVLLRGRHGIHDPGQSLDVPAMESGGAKLIPGALKNRDIILAYGKTGMGKTQWARRFLADKTRQLIIDPILEYDGLLFEEDQTVMLEHMQKYPAWRCRTPYPEDFGFMCQVAMAAGRCWLVIEETQRVMPASRKELPGPFLDVLYRGRHTRVSVLMISQRPSTVNIAARSQWTRIVTFNQTEPADLTWLQSVSGFDLDPASLPKFHYYDITPAGCEKKILDIHRKRIDRLKHDDIPQPAGRAATDAEPAPQPVKGDDDGTP